MKKAVIGFFVCMFPAGIFYVLGAGDIGKSVIAYWGLAAVLVGAISLLALARNCQRLAAAGCVLLSLMQLPCLYSWAVVGFPGFHLLESVLPGGPVFVAGEAALLMHLLLAAWGAAGAYWILSRREAV